MRSSPARYGAWPLDVMAGPLCHCGNRIRSLQKSIRQQILFSGQTASVYPDNHD
jgi:hypothetical protein